MGNEKTTTTVITPAGRVVEVPNEAIEEAGGVVGREATAAERLGDLERQANEETYGGWAGKASSVAHGIASGLTGGVSEALLRSAGGGDVNRGLAEANPVLRGGAELVGTIAGPGKLAGGLGRAATKRAGGGIAAGALGGAVEGVGYGVAQTGQELALSDDPLTLERVASSLSSNVALGGAVGGAVGGAAKAAQRAIVRGRKAASAMAARTSKAASVPDDLAALDSKGLRVAEEAALADAKAVQVAGKAKIADDIGAYHDNFGDAFLVADGKAKAEMTKAHSAIRRQLGNQKGLQSNPGKALDALERQEQALIEVAAKADDTLAKLAAEEQKLARSIAEDVATMPAGQTVLLEGKAAKRYADFAGVKVGKEGARLGPDEASAFITAIEGGETSGARAAALGKVQGLLEQNRAIQQSVKAAYEAPTSTRLKAIADAKDLLASPPQPGLLSRLADKGGTTVAMGAMTGLLPGGAVGAVGAMLAGDVVRGVKGMIAKRFTGAAAEQSARTAKAVATLMDVGSKAARVAPPVATRVLSSVSFGAERPGRVAKSAAVAPTSLAASFRAREAELRGQIEDTPAGPQMTRAARMRVSANLAGVRAADPLLADKIETMAARRIEFLASKLPRRPDFLALQSGPDKWHPSDMQMRAFARYVAAVEDPGGVEERLAAGTVTPEDAEAYRTVYPERFEDLKRQIILELPKLTRALPYRRQLSLSIFTGLPIDPAMRLQCIQRLQSNFASEEGSEGGTQAPRALPQFGSVSSSEKATPSQERAS